MTTKLYLNQIYRLDEIIKNKREEIIQLEAMAESITVATDKENVKSSGNKDKIGTAVAKIVDLQEEYLDILNEFLEKRKTIISQIENIEKIEFYNVLCRRYIQYKTFEEIAVEMDYSYRQITRIHGNALQAFERKYGEKYKNM